MSNTLSPIHCSKCRTCHVEGCENYKHCDLFGMCVVDCGARESSLKVILVLPSVNREVGVYVWSLLIGDYE